MNTQMSPKVLFVEDDGTIKLAMTEALRDAGFDVLEASNVSEAIKLLEHPDDIDILFTDVRMPGTLDGIDLALHVRRHHPNMPLLIASGYAEELTRRLTGIKPPKLFIDKPYSLQKVVNTLQEMIATR